MWLLPMQIYHFRKVLSTFFYFDFASLLNFLIRGLSVLEENVNLFSNQTRRNFCTL